MFTWRNKKRIFVVVEKSSLYGAMLYVVTICFRKVDNLDDKTSFQKEKKLRLPDPKCRGK